MNKFSQDGHFNTTIKILEIAGYPTHRIDKIAYYSQYPDIDKNYSAVHVGAKYILLPWKWRWRNNVLDRLHSLHGGSRNQVVARRNRLRSLLKDYILQHEFDWMSGILIHAFADAYAHALGS